MRPLRGRNASREARSFISFAGSEPGIGDSRANCSGDSATPSAPFFSEPLSSDCKRASSAWGSSSGVGGGTGLLAILVCIC